MRLSRFPHLQRLERRILYSLQQATDNTSKARNHLEGSPEYVREEKEFGHLAESEGRTTTPAVNHQDATDGARDLDEHTKAET